jgi:hypothetical protein
MKPMTTNIKSFSQKLLDAAAILFLLFFASTVTNNYRKNQLYMV